MKKVFLSVALVMAALVGASAQDEVVNKNGEPILPKAGDFGLSIDATPFFRFIGGIFSDNDANANNLFGNDYALSGSYFLTDNTSIRATLGFGFSTVTDKTYVHKIGGAADETVENSEKTGNSDFRLGVGYVFHRGHGRLQAFYGPEIALGLGRTNKKTYEYGNAISATNPVTRPTETKPGFNFGFGAGGFVGVEYFVAPRISISGEVGLNIGFNTKGDGVVTTESWDGSTVKSTETKTAGSNNFSFATTPRGNIGVSFYF
jgi:hypothetical protein